MEGVDSKAKQEHNLATAPAFNVMDVECADGTALAAKTADIATQLLQCTEEEYGTAVHGLRGNTTNTL